MAGNDIDVTLLVQSETTNGSTVFVDSGGGANCPHTITPVGNVQHSTAQAKFGLSSIKFDGSNDYLTITDTLTDFEFGTGDFTIDFWVYKSTAASMTFIGKGGSTASWSLTNGHEWILYFATNTLYFQINNNGVVLSKSVASPSLITSWHHIAVVNSAAKFSIFVDGVEILTSSRIDQIYTTDGTRRLVIGNSAALVSGYWINGYIEELRISKGVARWTTGFTPPTEPYSTEVIDGNSNALTITDSNDSFLLTDGEPNALAINGVGDSFSLTDGEPNSLLISSDDDAYYVYYVGADNDLSITDSSEAGAVIIAGESNSRLLSSNGDAFNWSKFEETYITNSGAVPKVKYELVVISKTKPAVYIPIESFSYSMRYLEPSQLSVVVPTLEYNEVINERIQKGLIIVIMTYETFDNQGFSSELGRANLEAIRLDEGANNQSMTLSGSYKARARNASSIVYMDNGYNYTSLEHLGDLTYRYPFPNPFVKAGDMAKFSGGLSFRIQSINIQVNSSYSTMEVRG